MIEPVFFFSPIWVMATAAITMIVLRGGISRIFFDIVGTFQATRLIHDAEAASTALQGLFVDSFSNVLEAVGELNQQIVELENAVIPVARELEIATIEFEKFFDTAVLTEIQMQSIADSVKSIGAEFGFVGDEALAAGGRAAQLQALYGPGVVEPLTKGGLALGFVGDMGGVEAQQALISLMQQNALVTGDLTQAQFAAMDALAQREVVTASVAKTLNKLNSVEDRSAARMPEIIEAMNHFGGVARLAGEDIGFMAAMSATLIERGIRAETAGTALRFTYARVGGDINGAGQALRDLGVATHDANGELRPMQQILNELAPAFNQMNDQQQQALAQTMAGNRHYARLLLLMQDLERSNMLYNEALNESGKVMEENGEAAGYLADLFANTAFQIEQTEARITNLQAAIGERLLPAQLEALKAQEDMLIAMDAIIQGFSEMGGFGEFVEDLYEARLIVTQLVAPFVTLQLNLMSVQIALQAMRAVMRAISGENIAFIRDQVSNNQLILIQEKQQILNAEIKAIKQQKTNNLSNYNLLVAKRQNIEGQRKSLIEERVNLLLTKQRQHQENIDLGKNRSNALSVTKNRLEEISLLLGERKARKGEQEAIILDSTVDIQKAINLLLEEREGLQIQLNDLSQRSAVYSSQGANAQKMFNAELKAGGMAAEGLSHSLTKVVGMSMFISMGFMIASSALMILGTEINNILPSFMHFENQAETMAGAMFLFVLSLMHSQIEMIKTIALSIINSATLANIALIYSTLIAQIYAHVAAMAVEQAMLLKNAIMTNSYLFVAGTYLVTKYAQIKAVIIDTAALAKNTLAYWLNQTAIGSLIVVNSGLLLSYGKLVVAYVAQIAGLLATQAAAWLASVGFGALGTAASFAFTALVGIAALTVAGLVLVGIAFAAIYAAKELFGLNFEVEKLGSNLEDIDYEIPTFDTTSIDGYADSLNSATEAQQNFNNSREELFFGFKAGNVQGALVKQIQQQGVETFIANTEVIQTNNFNGMTTREMANIVLDAIESEAGVRGINLSGASV